MKANNFDFLRHFLAFSVVWHHFNILTRSEKSFFIFDLVDSNVAVKAFFVISGLLIWVSANRSRTISAFAIKRLLRIYPALLFILLIVAAVFVLFYEQSISEVLRYFSWNSVFLSFMHPCVGDVFDSNVICAVNGSLWTLKLEVAYYAFVGIVVFFFRASAYKVIVIFTILSFLLEAILLFAPSSFQAMADILINQIPFKFYYFGLGVIIYNYEKLISTTQLLLVMTFGACAWLVMGLEFIFLPLFVVSFVYYVAFRLPVINFSKIGDLSYGLYIFHFPIIQLFVYNQWLSGRFYLDFIFVITLLLLLSKLSWSFIESRSIQFSKKLVSGSLK